MTVSELKPARTRMPEAVTPTAAPLIVDLDDTLLRTDTLFECALRLLKTKPLLALRIPSWLLKGRAFVKRQLALHAPPDIATLPLNDDVVRLAHEHKSGGGEVYLATAADHAIASAVADQCGFFDGVIATNGELNLKGKHKAEALLERFPQGFDYAGDSNADLAVWEHAQNIVAVGSPSWTRNIASRFEQPVTEVKIPSRLMALIRSARPHQWSKNLLVFIPAILGGAIHTNPAVVCVTLAFVGLSLIASGTYLLNDLWDIEDDRRHWSKKHRPIASGALPISTALIAAPTAIATGLAIGAFASSGTAVMLAVYLGLSLTYSLKLKRIPVVDAVTLATLFTLRLVLGIVAAGVFASPWLLVFSMFLFTSLSFAKRYVEVARSAAKGITTVSARGYVSEDSPLLLAFGISTGISSVAIMVLYIIFDAFQRSFYGNTIWLWVFPVVLFLWIARVWLLAGRGELDDDPVSFAVKDKVSLALGATMLLAFVLAWTGASV